MSGTKTIFFAIDEVGSFAYLKPLFCKWLDTTPESVNWSIIIDPVIEKFHLYKELKERLPLLSFEQAMERTCDLLVLSMTNKPDFTLKLVKNSKNTLAFSGIWSKIWNADDYKQVGSIAVIDKEDGEIIKSQGWLGHTHIIGQPAWENIEAFPDASGTSILYAAQPIHKHYGLSLGYDEHTLWEFLCSLEPEKHGLKITYAVHPAQDQKSLPKNADFSYDAQSALKTHGTVVSAFSSLLLDAWFGERKALSIQPNRTGADKCYLSEKGLIPLVETSDDFFAQLSAKDAGLLQNDNQLKGSRERLESLLIQS